MAVSVSAATLPTPKTHTFSLGLEGGHAHYWDWRDNGQPNQDIGGLMGGVMADYTLTFSPFFIKLDTRAQWGKAKYSVTTYTNEKGTLRDVRTNMVDTRLVIGRSFEVREDLRIAPFVGVGYKTFNRANLAGRYVDFGSADGSLYYHGEDFRTHHIYLPIGATVTKALDDTWHFAATGEIDILLNGNASIKENDGARSEKVPQRRGFGVKADMAVVRQLDKMSLSVGPYFNYWTIKKRTKYTPSSEFMSHEACMNRSIETGLRIKFSF